MPRLPGASLRVGVSRQALALVRVRPFSAPALLAQVPVAGEGAAALDAALASLPGEGWAGWPVSFVLADDLVRLWTVAPPAGAARMGDLQAAAQLRFRQLFGEATDGWQLAASYHAKEPFLAAAVPRWLPGSLAAAARDRRMVVTAIEPHFVAAWNAWHGRLPSRAWLALIHDGLLTLGVAGGAGLLAVRPARMPAAAPPAWLDTHARREALLLGVAAPEVIALCGELPPGWEGQAGWLLLSGGGGAPGARLALAGVAA